MTFPTAKMASPRAQALGLFRSLLRESKRISNYNFRNHALRRVREEFRASASLETPEDVASRLAFGEEQLQLVRRQATISQLYPQEKHVLDKA